MWLMWSVAASAAPDLVIDSISVGCTGSEGDPTVVVRFRNAGTTAAGAFWVDLFRGLPSPPSIGTIGEDAFRVSGLAAGSTLVRSFTLPGEEGWTGWIDILIDTDRWISESNENNNHRDNYLTLLDCSFN